MSNTSFNTFEDSLSGKKSILFVMTTMGVGGIQSALRNLVAELAKIPFLSVTVLLFDKSTLRENDFSFNVEVIDAGILPQLIPSRTINVLKKSFYLAICRLIAGFLAKYVSQRWAYKFLFKKTCVNRKWDVAISFGQTSNKSLYGGMNEFVADYIDATKKIAFVHCDFVAMGLNHAYSMSVYEKFDKIALVSKSVKKVFDDAMPLLKSKTCVVYNCHDFDKIQFLAENEPFFYDCREFNFITVARFSKEKGLLRILPIIKKLKEEGLVFKWHIIGDGNPKYQKKFFNSLKKLKIADVVICHGAQYNPYRYMKNADVLLVPSFHEAAPMVFQEAEFLHLPILSTKTCSAVELVRDRKIGVVCENTDASICKNMRLFVLQSHLNFHSNSSCLNNALAVKQFMDLIK